MILLIAFGSWHPGIGTKERGSVIPINYVASTFGLGRGTVMTALDELCAKGLLKVVERGTRPNSQGSRRGKAARYAVVTKLDLPARTWSSMGDPKLKGCWRLDVDRLRDLLRRLSPEAIKLLAACHAVDRTSTGTPVSNPARPISSRAYGEAIGLGRTTVAKALKELVAAGQLAVVDVGRGRRATTYEFAPAALVPPSARKQRKTGKISV